MGYLIISTNVKRYQTHHRWQYFLSGRQRTGVLCAQHSPIEWKLWFSCFPVLPGSAEAQVIWGGIVKRLLIAYFIGNISAKKYQNPFMCVKGVASQRWDVFWDTVYLSNCLQNWCVRYNQRLQYKQDTETVRGRVMVLILRELRRHPPRTFRLCLHMGINARWASVTYFLLGQLVPANVRQQLTPLDLLAC